jgi:membrane-associated protease RseP (regulator of RpoE activity)
MRDITELPNDQKDMIKISKYNAESELQPNAKNIKINMYLVGFIILPILLFVLSATAAETSQENLYAKHYKAQNANNLKSSNPNVDTQMFVSNRKEDDNIRMLESGYDLMGTTGFEAGNVPPELALAHGKAIKADMVLVYSKYGNTKTLDSKMQMIREAAKNKKEITEADIAEEDIKYNYFASYWAKLPMPLMGVHVIKLVQSRDDGPKPEAGLKVIAVIKESAAAKANLMKGDVLLQLGEAKMDQPDDLFAAVKRYQGQTIPVIYERGGEAVSETITIGSRK